MIVSVNVATASLPSESEGGMPGISPLVANCKFEIGSE